MKLSTFIQAVLILTALITSCKKEEPIQCLENDSPTTLLDSLSGTFVGYRYFHKEEINCPGGMPPCVFTHTYDTILVNLQITKLNNDSIQITENVDGTCDRIIKMQSDLTYDGYPILNATSGHYKLNFTPNPYDSVYLDLESGWGGNNFGGEFHYYTYKLARQ